MAEQLKAKGFAEAKALNSDGKVRVSIRSFGNREEATKQLLELRKTKLIRMPGYWQNKSPFET